MARIRTFLGIDPGMAARSAAAKVQLALARTGANVKWVEAENLHVTLLFLGEVDDRDLANVCKAVKKAVKNEAPFPIRFGGIGAFPTMRQPKTIWAGVTDGASDLVRIHSLLEPPLEETGCYRREERAYTPHLTLGRCQSPNDAEALVNELRQFMAWTGGTTIVEEVVIYSSELRRNGPEYTVMGRAELQGLALAETP